MGSSSTPFASGFRRFIGWRSKTSFNDLSVSTVLQAYSFYFRLSRVVENLLNSVLNYTFMRQEESVNKKSKSVSQSANAIKSMANG